MPLTILWISHVADIDGASLTLVEAVEALAARGHTSHVVLPREGPLSSYLEDAATIHYGHHNQWVASRRVGHLTTARWLAYNCRAANWAIASIARAIRANVVVSNTGGVAVGGFGARSANVPHLWFLHELFSVEFGLRYLLGRSLTLRLMRHLASGIIAVSPAVRDEFRSHFSGVEVAVALPWVRVPAAETGGAPPPMPSGAPRLISVGSWIPGKAQSDGIDAVALLRRDGLEVHLELLGGTETWFRSSLEARAGSAGVADLIGFVPFRKDPTPHYVGAHAALMCSAHEALGRGAVEALKLGRPVIAAAGGGLLDVVRAGATGLLYTPHDPVDLARRIRELVTDRALLQRLGDEGRRDSLARFNRDRFGSALEDALARAARVGAAPTDLERTPAARSRS